MQHHRPTRRKSLLTARLDYRGQQYWVRIFDISVGGAKTSLVYEPLEEDSAVLFVQYTRLPAVIVWVTDETMGLQFTQPCPNDVLAALTNGRMLGKSGRRRRHLMQ